MCIILLIGGVMGLIISFYALFKQLRFLYPKCDILIPGGFVVFYGLFWGIKMVLVRSILLGVANHLYSLRAVY